MQEELHITLTGEDIERLVSEYAESVAFLKGYKLSFAKREENLPWPDVTYCCVSKDDEKNATHTPDRHKHKRLRT